MNNFIFRNPTKLIFGKGTISQLPKEIDPTKKVLLPFGGGSVQKNGVYDHVINALEGNDLVVHIISESLTSDYCCVSFSFFFLSFSLSFCLSFFLSLSLSFSLSLFLSLSLSLFLSLFLSLSLSLSPPLPFFLRGSCRCALAFAID